MKCQPECHNSVQTTLNNMCPETEELNSWPRFFLNLVGTFIIQFLQNCPSPILCQKWSALDNSAKFSEICLQHIKVKHMQVYHPLWQKLSLQQTMTIILSFWWEGNWPLSSSRKSGSKWSLWGLRCWDRKSI